MNKITNGDPTITGKGLDITLRVKQLALLAAAEESFCQAAGVLHPVLDEMMEHWDEAHVGHDPVSDRCRAALHLLEEAMACHNRYMESLQ